MRRTLFWKEMRELAPVLWVLVALELLLGLGFRLLPAGTLPDSFLATLAFFASAALGTSLFVRDGRRPGDLPLLGSLPIRRGRILAARLAAGLASVLLVIAGGLAVLSLAAGWGWRWTAPPAGGYGTVLLAALCGFGAAALWLRARLAMGESWAARPASGMRAPTLLAVEWRQKRSLLGFLALLPLLGLAGNPWLAQLPVFAWLAGALVGASLFPARERDASRSLLHCLPIGRGRLVAGRLLGGLAAGALYLAEFLLVLRAAAAIDHRAFQVNEIPTGVLMFAFFYGSAFLIGAALSPWLRSTVLAVLLAVVSTYLILLASVIPFGLRIGGVSGLLAATGALLALLAAVAAWSTVRSRAFEPMPRKDFLVVLTVFAVWLVIAAILHLS